LSYFAGFSVSKLVDGSSASSQPSSHASSTTSTGAWIDIIVSPTDHAERAGAEVNHYQSASRAALR
jgi:hypothetical protein